MKYENKLVKTLKGNCKPFFKYLKSKSQIKKSVDNLDTAEGNRTKTPAEAADTLAGFFQSVFKEESYGPLPKSCYNPKCDEKFDDNIFTIDCSEVYDILSKLDISKAMGPDDVHPKLLKFLSDDPAFVKTITLLFNKCVEQQCIPDVWKSTVVVPLHKNGSVHSPNNYRPVSLTCVICKVYEKVLRARMIDYVSGYISNTQHGFVKGRSCLSNLLETIDAANEYLAEGGCTDILYFDFSKAFDSVSHYRLLAKLSSYGFPQFMLNIIWNSLNGEQCA